jgi:hypothetical protein
MKPRQRLEELLTGEADILRFTGFHSGCDGLRGTEQYRRWRQSERGDPVTLIK